MKLSAVWRLLKRGPVELEFVLQNAFSGAPVQVPNVNREIRGVEKRMKSFVLGAHLDSWRTSHRGTTDDGTGASRSSRPLERFAALDVSLAARSGLSCFQEKNKAPSARENMCGVIGASSTKISAVP